MNSSHLSMLNELSFHKTSSRSAFNNPNHYFFLAIFTEFLNIYLSFFTTGTHLHGRNSYDKPALKQ